MIRCAVCVGVIAILCAGTATAQSLEQRGFVEVNLTAYPQSAPRDSVRAVGESLLRYEPSLKFSTRFAVNAALEARADTHRQVEREFDVTYWDRTIPRPMLAIRRLSATYFRGPLTFELGKQFIRWGKTDILNPTDRFAPRDYLTVVNNELLAVTAARITLATQSDAFDLVYTPRFTPSRVPLLNQRWTVVPAAAGDIPLQSAPVIYPGGPQFGARWDHTGTAVEYSFSFFQGFNHLPSLVPELRGAPLRIELTREYPKIRTYGADLALPLRWLTLKAEAAWFQSLSRTSDEYVLYVVQLERQHREWLFIGGYAGEEVTLRRIVLSFAPDRGLADAFIGRASWTLGTQRNVAFEAVARRNGKGFYGKVEYSHAVGSNWRATAGFVLIRGSESDFLGQYSRNSFGSLAVRYSY